MSINRVTMNTKCAYCGSAIRAFKVRNDFESRKLHLKCWKIEQDMKMLKYQMSQLKLEEEKRKREEEERQVKQQLQIEESRKIWNSKTPEERKAIQDKWNKDEAEWNAMTDSEKRERMSRW